MCPQPPPTSISHRPIVPSSFPSFPSFLSFLSFSEHRPSANGAPYRPQRNALGNAWEIRIEKPQPPESTAKPYNAGKPQEEHILQCIGLGYGPLLRIGDDDVFGPEVNAASKLGEDIAHPWEILVTESVQAAAATAAEEENIPGLHFQPIADIPPGANSAARLLYDL